MRVVKVKSRDDPRIADFVSTRDPELLKKRGVFIAESPFVVKTLIERSSFEVRAVFCSQARLEALAPTLENIPEDVPVYVVDRSLVNDLVGFRIHKGCLASGIRGEPKTARSILDSLGSGRRTLVVLESVSNHDNIGSIFRNASGLGVDAVLLNQSAASPLYRKAIRVSVASTLTLPFGRFQRTEECMRLLRERGFESWALTPRSLAIGIEAAIEGMPADSRVAIWLGAEGPGLTEEAIELADRAVQIPMSDGPDALNVASSSAIALYLLNRR